MLNKVTCSFQLYPLGNSPWDGVRSICSFFGGILLVTDNRGRKQNWTETPFRPWCASDIYERKRNSKQRTASENYSHLTESLVTQLAALEQKWPVQRVSFWVEVAHYTQSLAGGFLWKLRHKLKCYGWKLLACFSPCGWMASSFLKGNLSRVPPHLFQSGRLSTAMV